MRISRVFMSAQQNPASGNSTPSGIADAIVMPAAPLGAAVALPGALTGDTPANVVTVINKGADTLHLAYADGVTALPASVPQTPATRRTVAPGKSAYLTDAAGLAVSYWGGPFTALAGRFYYGVVDETLEPDYPGAATSL